MFDKLKNQTEMLNKIGIKLNFLDETQTLRLNSYMTINYGGGVVTILEPPAHRFTADFEGVPSDERRLHQHQNRGTPFPAAICRWRRNTLKQS
ncbi:MAG: hypothetical protein U1F16_09425 [Turneriella sp.]